MGTRRLLVFEQPRKGECYCIGADVAEGGPRGDFSAAQVLRRPVEPGKPLRQVAVYREHIDPDEFADDLLKVALFYEWAWLGIENNMMGLATTSRIFRQHRYSRLYWEQRPDKETFGGVPGRVGWRTTFVSRPLLLAGLAEVVRTDQIIIAHKETIEECLNFRQDQKTGRFGAIGKNKYDDLVMALGIAVQMHTRCPITSGPPSLRIDDEEPFTTSQFTDKDFLSQFLERQRAKTLASASGDWYEEN